MEKQNIKGGRRSTGFPSGILDEGRMEERFSDQEGGRTEMQKNGRGGSGRWRSDDVHRRFILEANEQEFLIMNSCAAFLSFKLTVASLFESAQRPGTFTNLLFWCTLEEHTFCQLPHSKITIVAVKCQMH